MYVVLHCCFWESMQLLKYLPALSPITVRTNMFTLFLCLDRITCDNSSNATYTATVSFSYPFRPSSFRFLYNPTYNTSSGPGCATPTIDNLFSGAAEFYVFMSVITFLLGILALVVYVIFYVPRYDIAKYISLIVSWLILLLPAYDSTIIINAMTLLKHVCILYSE